MQATLTALLLSGLEREALKVVAALVLAFAIVVVFTVSSVAALLGSLGSLASPSGPLAGHPMSGPTGARVVVIARSQTGMPYVWGGASPSTGFDCSGLVQWSYARLGVSLPRTAQEQYNATVRVGPGGLQPGDLVFFAYTYPSSPSEPITHVGIYVGDGQMINAPTDGDVVRVMPVFTGFWGAHFAGAGRVER